MIHFVDKLAPDYRMCLSAMKITPTRSSEVAAVASKLIKFSQQGRYAQAATDTGVPQIWMASSFEREASSNFRLSPAQGDPWDRLSVNVPKNRGPFNNWTEAARDAYHLDGLDKIGPTNWTWILACYFGELFNGFGPRDVHGIRTSYLWGATNLQQRGKYVRDGVFDSSAWDEQIGIVPVMAAMCELSPGLTIAGDWPFPAPESDPRAPTSASIQTPIAHVDVKAVQRALNAKGFGPLLDDGSFGRKTSAALRAFEAKAGLTPDGLLDQKSVDALLAP